ncbi:MAG: mechanosensitive ion channel family protein [Candidatus Puniceispirillales bacterium]
MLENSLQFMSFDFSIIADWAGNVVSGLVIIIIGVFVSRKANTATRRALEKISGFDRTLIPLSASIIRYGILLVTLVAALGSFGIQTTSIIAVLGAAGLAIGLALQGTLSNVAAGVMLLFLRPFQAGDWIETGSHSGTVKEIGLFTTIMITFDNIYISIPNSSIWGATITNHSQHETRRMDIDIGISYSSDLDLVEKTLLALADDERVLTSPEPQFLVVSYDDSAITVRLRLYARYDDFFALNWDLLRRLKPALDKAGIEIPFPQREYRLLS